MITAALKFISFSDYHIGMAESCSTNTKYRPFFNMFATADSNLRVKTVKHGGTFFFLFTFHIDAHTDLPQHTNYNFDH